MTRTEQTAKLFRRHRRQWVSAITLTKVGGLLAWRTEVSRCRTQLGMNIEWSGDTRNSRYRYVGLRKAA